MNIALRDSLSSEEIAEAIALLLCNTKVTEMSSFTRANEWGKWQTCFFIAMLFGQVEKVVHRTYKDMEFVSPLESRPRT